MANSPRYRVWIRLLRQATEAGLLSAQADPDAFAIASSQLIAANVLAWARGELTLGEMQARHHYGKRVGRLLSHWDLAVSRLDMVPQCRCAHAAWPQPQRDARATAGHSRPLRRVMRATGRAPRERLRGPG